jgi:hypothetical protein
MQFLARLFALHSGFSSASPIVAVALNEPGPGAARSTTIRLFWRTLALRILKSLEMIRGSGALGTWTAALVACAEPALLVAVTSQARLWP